MWEQGRPILFLSFERNLKALDTEEGFILAYILISIPTPAGSSKCIKESIVLSVG